MNTVTLSVNNVKCDGCASNIQTALGALSNVSKTEVDVPTGQVSVYGQDLNPQQIADTLAALGYPVKN